MEIEVYLVELDDALLCTRFVNVFQSVGDVPWELALLHLLC